MKHVSRSTVVAAGAGLALVLGLALGAGSGVATADPAPPPPPPPPPAVIGIDGTYQIGTAPGQLPVGGYETGGPIAGANACNWLVVDRRGAVRDNAATVAHARVELQDGDAFTTKNCQAWVLNTSPPPLPIPDWAPFAAVGSAAVGSAATGSVAIPAIILLLLPVGL
ncbi:hypothetical protein OG921_07620 [Aldersonia sp. NBC_00410]|uniref:hypothetical protein n=1 Tax=Aldersonia sp. NBC_00410 TaxID=2975954 RepID=UPI0022547AB2|nr:hypothetical protein [Aldersonia sp. NBC_00410]MCX5043036.1 hypothetical protein [Aldersonia sp. NBC_00410]